MSDLSPVPWRFQEATACNPFPCVVDANGAIVFLSETDNLADLKFAATARNNKAVDDEDYNACHNQLKIALNLVELTTKRNQSLLAIARELAEKHQRGKNVCTFCGSAYNNAGNMPHNPGCAVQRFWDFLAGAAK